MLTIILIFSLISSKIYAESPNPLRLIGHPVEVNVGENVGDFSKYLQVTTLKLKRKKSDIKDLSTKLYFSKKNGQSLDYVGGVVTLGDTKDLERVIESYYDLVVYSKNAFWTCYGSLAAISNRFDSLITLVQKVKKEDSWMFHTVDVNGKSMIDYLFELNRIDMIQFLLSIKFITLNTITSRGIDVMNYVHDYGLSDLLLINPNTKSQTIDLVIGKNGCEKRVLALPGFLIEIIRANNVEGFKEVIAIMIDFTTDMIMIHAIYHYVIINSLPEFFKAMYEIFPVDSNILEYHVKEVNECLSYPMMLFNNPNIELDFVSILLDYFPDAFFKRSSKGRNFLYLAITGNSNEMVTLVLSKLPKSKYPLLRTITFGETLFEYSLRNCVDCVVTLIESGLYPLDYKYGMKNSVIEHILFSKHADLLLRLDKTSVIKALKGKFLFNHSPLNILVSSNPIVDEKLYEFIINNCPDALTRVNFFGETFEQFLKRHTPALDDWRKFHENKENQKLKELQDSLFDSIEPSHSKKKKSKKSRVDKITEQLENFELKEDDKENNPIPLNDSEASLEIESKSINRNVKSNRNKPKHNKNRKINPKATSKTKMINTIEKLVEQTKVTPKTQKLSKLEPLDVIYQLKRSELNVETISSLLNRLSSYLDSDEIIPLIFAKENGFELMYRLVNEFESNELISLNRDQVEDFCKKKLKEGNSLIISNCLSFLAELELSLDEIKEYLSIITLLRSFDYVLFDHPGLFKLNEKYKELVRNLQLPDEISEPKKKIIQDLEFDDFSHPICQMIMSSEDFDSYNDVYSDISDEDSIDIILNSEIPTSAHAESIFPKVQYVQPSDFENIQSVSPHDFMNILSECGNRVSLFELSRTLLQNSNIIPESVLESLMIFTLWQTNLEHVHSFTRLVLSLADEFNLTLQTLINHLFELPKIYFNEARFNQFIALKYYNAYRIMNSFYKHNIINAQFIIEQLLLLKNQSSYNEISATAYRILSDGIIFPPNVQISELN